MDGDTAPRLGLYCTCSTHIVHAEMCDEECECWGGIRRVTIAKSERFADVTTRIWLRREPS